MIYPPSPPPGLLHYLQQNYTGPFLPSPSSPSSSSSSSSSTPKPQNLHIHALTPSPTLKNLTALATALSHTTQTQTQTQSTEKQQEKKKNWWHTKWWRLRCLKYWQETLDENISEIFEEIEECARYIENSIEAQETFAKNPEIHAQYNLERALLFQRYNKPRKALEYLEKAKVAAGFEFNVTGKLGKRTRFQKSDYAQLCIETSRTNLVDLPAQNTDAAVPEALALNDDTLLESIEYVDTEGNVDQNINVIDQCILLAFCGHVKSTNPIDGITTEQMFPYATKVLEQAADWSVHTFALLTRSRLEHDKGRTMERAVLQLQALVDQMNPDAPSPAHASKKDPDAHDRMNSLFMLEMPSVVNLEKELGQRYAKLGALRSAFEIFKRLQLWKDAIDCLVVMGEEEKAKALINDEMRKTEDALELAKLTCILGELDNDIALLEKSWEMSNHRLSRAMRSLGQLHLRNERWKPAIIAFNKSLQLNPMFENVWHSLGCAAMQDEDWTEAIRAFTKVVALDSENGNAWNNLAAIQIKLGQKVEAHRSLREALKQKYASASVWQNFLWLSLDLQEWADGLFASERILETADIASKPQFLDVEALSHLLSGIERSDPSPNRAHLLKRFGTLLGHITSKISNKQEIWDLYAAYNRSMEDYDKLILNKLAGYRAISAKNKNWERELEEFEIVSSYILDIAKQALALSRNSIGNDIWSKIQFLLRTTLRKTEADFETHDLYLELMDVRRKCETVRL